MCDDRLENIAELLRLERRSSIARVLCGLPRPHLREGGGEVRRVLARAGGDLQHVDAALWGRRQVGLQHLEDGLLVAGRRRGEALAWIGRVAGEADAVRLCHGSSHGLELAVAKAAPPGPALLLAAPR